MVLGVSILLFVRSGISSGVLVYYSQYVLGSSNYYTALAMSGYVGGAAVQSGSAILSMKLCLIPIPVIVCLALMLVLKFYKLDAELPKITEDLAAGRTEKDKI